VDQTAHAHVLLETVALAAHENQEFAGTGREPEVGDSTQMQQQQLLADVQNPGDQPSMSDYLSPPEIVDKPHRSDTP
jgi:hypothetical protein